MVEPIRLLRQAVPIVWGKTETTADGLRLLPLECHLLDVAAVFEGLCSTRAFRLRLERAFGRTLTRTDVARLCCLAALHDLGKIPPGFQNKAFGGTSGHGHIAPLAGLFSEPNLSRLIAAFPFLTQWDDAEGGTVYALLQASFSHHGALANLAADQAMAALWPKDPTATAWDFMRRLGEMLRQWFPEAFAADAPPLPGTPLLAHLFAGLVMLADWLGSDTRFFPIADSSGRCVAHPEGSRNAAHEALTATGLDIRGLEGLAAPDFEEEFGFAPNTLQRAVEEIPVRRQGGIAIIEAETGIGKTEAALRYFVRLWQAGLVDGLYFANPLRFAATQLFGRLRRFAAAAFGAGMPPVVLAVPGMLREDEATGTLLPDFKVQWDDNPDAAKSARRWAAEHPKRFLAAPLAAGTIDQALLGALQVKHAHMRASVLSRSLLVIDEVHASDTYMASLTHGLLEYLRDLGGQVLLLSATLGGHARGAYLRAMGSREPLPCLGVSMQAPYPCITTLDGVITVKDDRPANQRKQPVRVRLSAIQDQPEAVARLAAELAANGGRVLVLRNSVAAACETLTALEAILPTEALFSCADRVCPHHSRFARADRQKLDAEVEARFGKNGRGAGVLVATQTLEQSLDVDFDVLITDLCPMDVLLQRIGRLHRHRARDPLRPLGLAQPVCHVLTPPERTPEALDAAKRFQYGRDRAYANTISVMATWEQLAGRDAANAPLRIPQESRELVEAATHPDALEELAGRLGMQTKLNDLLGRAGAQAMAGKLNRIQWSRPFDEFAGASDSKRKDTRLGLSDLSVTFAEPFPGPFGNAVDRLNIPDFLTHNFNGGLRDAEAAPELLERGDGFAVFRLGSLLFRYDRLGLRKEEAQ